MKGYIGLDIGGTKILGAIFDESGKIIKKVKKKTKAQEGIEQVIKQIYKVTDELLEEKFDLLGIGAGSPGIILDESVVAFSPNIPFRDFDLGKKMKQRYKVPFVLGNDVNVGMFGEWKKANVKGAKNILGLFIGTGIGGAIIIDKKLYTGQGGAAELGHIVVEPGGAKCGCGSLGCLEAYSSKTGIQNAIEDFLQDGEKSVLSQHIGENKAIFSSSDLKKAYDDKDAVAVKVMDQAVYYIGVATGSLINIFHPDLIIFGGGIIEAMGEPMLLAIKEEAEHHVMPTLFKDVRFDLSHLGDEAGIYGAYYLIKDNI